MSGVDSIGVLFRKSFRLYTGCELWSSALDELPTSHDVDFIDADMLKYREIMRDDDDSIVRTRKLAKHLCYHTKGIQIKSRVYLIEDDISWLDQFELEDFEFSSLSSTKSDIEISIEKLKGDIKLLTYRCDKTFENKRRECFCAWFFMLQMDIVDGS